MPDSHPFSPIPEVLEDIRQGKMVILMDDENRENEGDLILAAEHVTPEAINFMVQHARGLVCLALTRRRAEHLRLTPMSRDNGSRYGTNFTISIEAREGISTGISAYDRAHTIQTAVSARSHFHDIVSPGHVFPLIAQDGGVLMRTGHTEAAVDLARLAGLQAAAGVICEILNPDGSMARLADLIPYAQQHGLKLATIADLVAYRRRYDNLLKRQSEETIQTDYGIFRCVRYRNLLNGSQHFALVKGDIKADKPVYVRVHPANLLQDMAGLGGHDSLFRKSMQFLAQQDCGVCVVLSSSGMMEDIEMETATEDHGPTGLRAYGNGAQILCDLGISQMIVLTRPPFNHHIALEGYGLQIIDYMPIEIQERVG